eukprot:TRINITY_DN61230_c0_g1_i1.p1 TRINITY_DN61230_c0_g1~~TRINITY_DN61230_c0_g1_i1.p1  ORF type:complete len:316 (-),score=104.89 TRINITY_DN61230_c0_g1_i1:123-1070(-)
MCIRDRVFDGMHVCTDQAADLLDQLRATLDTSASADADAHFAVAEAQFSLSKLQREVLEVEKHFGRAVAEVTAACSRMITSPQLLVDHQCSAELTCLQAANPDELELSWSADCSPMSRADPLELLCGGGVPATVHQQGDDESRGSRDSGEASALEAELAGSRGKLQTAEKDLERLREDYDAVVFGLELELEAHGKQTQEVERLEDELECARDDCAAQANLSARYFTSLAQAQHRVKMLSAELAGVREEQWVDGGAWEPACSAGGVLQADSHWRLLEAQLVAANRRLEAMRDVIAQAETELAGACLLYTSPSPRDS